MKTQLGIRTKDLKRIFAAVDKAHVDGPWEADVPAGGLPASVLLAILDVVACDGASYLVVDPYRRKWIVDQDSPGEQPEMLEPDPDRIEELFWQNFQQTISCSYHYRSGDHATVCRATDFYPSKAAFLNSDHGELMRLMSTRFSTLLPLHPNGVVQHRVVLWRDTGSDFSERDQLLLRLLQPHLADLELELRRRRHSAGLTARQVQLLDMVADGLTNRQIAHRLGLSEGTIRTHMENIFQRLDVTSRSAAVAKLAAIRSGPAPSEPVST